MEKILITELDLKSARSYVPVAEKEEFVEHCYQRCFSKVQINLGDDENGAMPNMYMENAFAKSKFLMSALVAMYLGKEKELETVDGDPWLMTDRQFDLWAGSHVLGQIERMKKKAPQDLQDKVFDLLRDYKDLERRLSAAIYHGLVVENDPVNRLFLKLSMDSTPEAFEAQRKALEEVTREFEEYKRAKEAQENQEG